MKTINRFYTFLSIITLISFSILSCEKDEVNDDYLDVSPYISALNGPIIAFQSSTVTYSISPFRGGSEYIWSVNGAEIQPIDGKTDKVKVFFNQAEEPVSISVKEKSANGKVSEEVEIAVEVVCNPQHGDYVVDMHDSYGDGWQTDDANGGSGMTIDIDGTIIEIGLCNPYVGSDYDCTGDYSDASTTVTIPEGTISAVWYFPGDEYGEISFEIYAPDGSLAFASGEAGETGEGQVPVVVCVED